MQGDSGGSWLRWVDGAWQLIGVNDVVRGITRESPGDPAGATSPLVHLPGGQTMLGWVRDTAALPNPPVGTIVRNLHTGASWLVGSDHYRRWISTGAVYQCLAGQGHRVFNADQIAIDSIPDRVGVHATCKTTATSGDFLLRITPDRVSSQLGAWQTGANGTYVSARRAYGFPDSCSVTPSRREIYAGWNEKLPVGWVFQLAPGWPLPTAYQVCKGLAPAAFFDRGGCIDRRCLTAEGLRFGDPVTKLRQLYPNATTHYMYNELRYWLVTDASGQPLLSVSTSNDRVGTFWVNLHLWQR
jgi:hypothetical protein